MASLGPSGELGTGTVSVVQSDTTDDGPPTSDPKETHTIPPRTLNDAPVDLLPAKFVGRQAELDFISEAFGVVAPENGSQRYCFIHSMDGLGKTKLALEYARRSFEIQRYSHIFWTSADTMDKLIRGFCRVLDLIGHPDRYQYVREDNAAATKTWLEGRHSYYSPGHWLLILDNVHWGVAHRWGDLLPATGSRGNILFTTRYADLAEFIVPNAGRRLHLGPFPMHDVTDLFLSNAGMDAADVSPSQLSQVQGLCKSVGHLPLSVVQLASYVRQTHSSLVAREELERKSEDLSEVFQKHQDLTAGEQQAVVAGFSNQFDRLRNESQDFTNILKLLSFLDPDVSVEMMVRGAREWLRKLDDRPPPPHTQRKCNIWQWAKKGSRGQEFVGYFAKIQADELSQLGDLISESQSLLKLIASPNSFQEALRKLQDWSMIQCRSSAGNSFIRMHEMIQVMIRKRAKREEAYSTWLRCATSLVCLAFEHIDDPESRQWWPDCEDFIPHVQSLSDHWGGVDGSNIDLAAANVVVAKYMIGRGAADDAEDRCEEAIEIYEKELGPNHPRTLQAIHSRGRVWLNQGLYTEGEEGTKRALEGRKKLLGASHKHTLDSMNNLALIYRYQGKFRQSEAMFVQMLAIEEKKLGAHHSNTLSTLENLAFLYEARGRWSEAEQLHKRGLESHEKMLGFHHPRTLQAAQRLAYVYQVQRRYEAAEELLVRALAEMKMQLGADHPWTVEIAVTLYNMYRYQGLQVGAYAICN